MAIKVDPPMYTPDEIIRLGNTLYIYRNGRLVDITTDRNFNIPQGQSTYTPDNIIRVGNALYYYENGILKDITTDREYDIQQGQSDYIPDETIRRGNALYDYRDGILKDITVDRQYDIPQGQSAYAPSREYNIPQGQSAVSPPGPYRVPPQAQAWRELDNPSPAPSTSTSPRETVVTRGDQNYIYVDGVLRGVTPVSGNNDYQVQQNADAAYYSNVIAYNREQQARQEQAAAVAAARERALAPYRDLATTLLEQLASGDYMASEKDLRGRLNKISKRAGKGINKGYAGLQKFLRNQENPFANLQATTTEVPASLATLLAEQGVGSNILEQEIAAQQMANASGGSAFADLANQLAAAYTANQQGMQSEARLQKRYAKDILANQKAGYGTQLAASGAAKRAGIEDQLAQIGQMGVELPDNWQTLADRGRGLRKLAKLSPEVQTYLKSLAGA